MRLIFNCFLCKLKNCLVLKCRNQHVGIDVVFNNTLEQDMLVTEFGWFLDTP